MENGRRRRGAPEAWIAEIVAAKAVSRGGVIRRASAGVGRKVGRDRFITDFRTRWFHLFECGRERVVICGPGALRIFC